MKDRSWLVLIALGLLAVTVAACGTADEPTASPIPEPTETKPNSCNDDDCFIIPAGTRFPQSGSGSCIHFTDDTRVEPRVEEFAVNPVAEEDLPPHDYLGDVIASLEIMPDGCSFSPPIEIIFKLSPPGRYEAGKRLPVYQYVESIDSWDHLGDAEVNSRQDEAIGSINHTSLFVLAESTSEAPLPTLAPTVTREPAATDQPTPTPTKRPTPTPIPTGTPSPTLTPTAASSPTFTPTYVPLYEVINFSVIDDWGQQVQLSVDYVFKTDFPGDEYISARPLSDTLDLGYFRSDSALLELGPNSAVINISYGFAGVPTPDRVTTDQIQFFMYVEGFEFYAEAFDYEKIWSIPTYP